MITVTLYRRAECHLCEVAEEALGELNEQFPHQLFLLDIDKDPILKKKFDFEVPVIEIGPYQLKAPFTKEQLAITLAAAYDRKKQLDSLQDPEYQRMIKRGQSWSRADGIILWISKHYLWFLNLIVFLYVGLPFLAPVLMFNGLTTPATFIYKSYGIVCHQLAFRSFFLFGEQIVYPRSAAGLSEILSYSEATGFVEDNSPESIFTARDFIGNKQIGYKIALCQRDVSIYCSILFFGIVFAISGRRLKSIHWILWIVIGLVPIGMDGISQILSQPPFNLLAYRESTPFLRFLTGFLFGFMTAWFGYPVVEETMADTRSILSAKLGRIQQRVEAE